MHVWFLFANHVSVCWLLVWWLWLSCSACWFLLLWCRTCSCFLGFLLFRIEDVEPRKIVELIGGRLSFATKRYQAQRPPKTSFSITVIRLLRIPIVLVQVAKIDCHRILLNSFKYRCTIWQIPNWLGNVLRQMEMVLFIMFSMLVFLGLNCWQCGDFKVPLKEEGVRANCSETPLFILLAENVSRNIMI